MIGRASILAILLSAATQAVAAEPGCTGPKSQVRLIVNVDNVRSAKGLIAVTLYADDSKRFLAKRGSLYVGRVVAAQGRTQVCIHLPRTGVYGLAVYHDADADRSFDRNALGLPKEAYGFSNNAPTLFGLPSFSAVRINVPRSDFETTVRLRHP
jgi:uncharacterized protein (DUF2141 family)